MSDKITDQHRARKAVLYVRQSSAYQVAHNEESRRLQYAMQRRLRDFGWAEVDVIDEDMGRSAAGTVERSGFQRMVAEVCLGKVGVVAAREVSRFARNSRDWQKLVEVCRMVDTLLMDQEAIYDPRRTNDRLLLGLKGSMNEYELDLLRQRSLEARREKARRGELIVIAPVGYRKTAGQSLEKDPDLRVQQALGAVYKKFLELGSVRQTLMWFLEHEIQLPATRHGPAGWDTVWKRPRYGTIMRILRDPTYAGAYGYGRSQATTTIRDGEPRTFQAPKPIAEWGVLIREHHEGYITWDQFQRIDAMISRNAQVGDGGPGAPKGGSALLAGLLRCRRCGRKMMVIYTGRAHDMQRYVCIRGHLDQGESKCISFRGRAVDDAVSREVLRVVEPGAIEAAVLAGQEEAHKQDEFLQALGLELKAARYEADHAGRQFDAADPANRLVADELERRWNAALERVQAAERRIEEGQKSRGQIEPPSIETLRDLAQGFEVVWDDPQTDTRLKKRIVRVLIEEVIADVDSSAAEVVLVIHWKGGAHTELRVRRRRRGQNGAHTSEGTTEAVRTLALICGDDVIAGMLNRNGSRTGRGNRWTRERVTSLRTWRRIPPYSPERSRSEGWMNLTQAASYLGVSAKTVRRAAERGDIVAMHPLSDGPWVLKRDNLDDPSVRVRLGCKRQSSKEPAGPISGQISLDISTT